MKKKTIIKKNKYKNEIIQEKDSTKKKLHKDTIYTKKRYKKKDYI